MVTSPKAASQATPAANRAALQSLAFDDVRDFEDVRRGLISKLPDGGVICDCAAADRHLRVPPTVPGPGVRLQPGDELLLVSHEATEQEIHAAFQ
ncbi:hypothetical protein ABZZ47_34880 [Streptomyces sp. NPDC006465]|uniref:hypothetical protein n=1 Tax=Streptomyces sp. NPDC006465 TaxID=3157174 RepID=UPI0033BA1FBA